MPSDTLHLVGLRQRLVRLYWGSPAVLLPRILKPPRATSVGGVGHRGAPMEGHRKVQVLDDQPGDKPAAPASGAELINRSLEMASLDQQVRQSLQAYSQRPRQAYISARTQEFKYASYMNEWVGKVERVGNLNYPDEARRQNITGSLMLQVSINTDDSVRNIRLLRPSGQKVLDDAAIRIVQLAAPFAPLPPEISKDTDILHITRTWEFLNQKGLSTRR